MSSSHSPRSLQLRQHSVDLQHNITINAKYPRSCYNLIKYNKHQILSLKKKNPTGMNQWDCGPYRSCDLRVIVLAGDRTWRWRWGTDVNGGMWKPILQTKTENTVRQKCGKRKKEKNLLDPISWLPDVIKVVDLILLQYTSPHFYHLLH